jgi:hypothetical protein
LTCAANDTIGIYCDSNVTIATNSSQFSITKLGT